MDVKTNYINTTSASGTPLFLFTFISFLPGSLVSRTLSADKVGGESCDVNSRTFIHSLWSALACPHTKYLFSFLTLLYNQSSISRFASELSRCRQEELATRIWKAWFLDRLGGATSSILMHVMLFDCSWQLLLTNKLMQVNHIKFYTTG